jgi:hypothetical protein
LGLGFGSVDEAKRAEIEARSRAFFAEYLEEARAVPWTTRHDMAEKLTVSREDTQEAEPVRDALIEGCLEATAFLALHLAPTWMNDLDAVQEANHVLLQLMGDPSVPSPMTVLIPTLLERYAEMNPWPPQSDDGTGVREPREPSPAHGGGAILLPVEEPADDFDGK